MRISADKIKVMISSDKVLEKLIEHLLLYLEELTKDKNFSPFTQGEIIAFVECLEIIKDWKKFKRYGLDDIEKRFPVD